jgi:hypothetical protein
VAGEGRRGRVSRATVPPPAAVRSARSPP